MGDGAQGPGKKKNHMHTAKLLVAAGAVALSAQAGHAAVTAEGLISGLQADGYGWVEVKRGPTQFEVEAVRGKEKVEMVIDAATGAVLHRETERADREDRARSGSQVRDRNHDFVDSRGRELDDDDDRRRGDRHDRHDDNDDDDDRRDWSRDRDNDRDHARDRDEDRDHARDRDRDDDDRDHDHDNDDDDDDDDDDRDRGRDRDRD